MLNAERILLKGIFSRFLRQCSSLPTTTSNCVVQTTGYTFKEPSGATVAKYGVYFDEGDTRNTWKTIYTGTTYGTISYVSARIYAIIEAIKMIDPKENVLVKTDFDYSWERLKKLAEKNFSVGGEKIKNGELLEELYNILKDRSGTVSFEYYDHHKTHEKNPVTKLLMDDYRKMKLPTSSHIVNHGDALNADGEIPSVSSTGWPVVYVKGMVSTTKGFSTASYATFWPNNEVPSSPPQRLSSPIATLFRAELSGILLAVEQARQHKLEKVVVMTSCPFFMMHWKHGWKTSRGEDVANKYLYHRIYDLIVQFHYQEPSQSPIWQTLQQKCAEGGMLPTASIDRTDLGRTIEDITRIRCKDMDMGKQVRRVRFFKMGTFYTAGLYWDKTNSTESVEYAPPPSGHQVDIILAIMKRIKKEGEDVVIIRTDSTKLIKYVESYMPAWRQNGYRRSHGQKIADREKCEDANEILDTVKVYWELMDPPMNEDIEVMEKFTKKRRRSRRKSKSTDDSIPEPIAATG